MGGNPRLPPLLPLNRDPLKPEDGAERYRKIPVHVKCIHISIYVVYRLARKPPAGCVFCFGWVGYQPRWPISERRCFFFGKGYAIGTFALGPAENNTNPRI